MSYETWFAPLGTQFAGWSLAIFCLRVARDLLDHDSTLPIEAVNYMALGREASRQWQASSVRASHRLK
jgi:hypothetical protein